jgi:hypothetical protein
VAPASRSEPSGLHATVTTELLCKSVDDVNGCLTKPHHPSHRNVSQSATAAFRRYAAVRS